MNPFVTIKEMLDQDGMKYTHDEEKRTFQIPFRSKALGSLSVFVMVNEKGKSVFVGCPLETQVPEDRIVEAALLFSVLNQKLGGVMTDALDIRDGSAMTVMTEFYTDTEISANVFRGMIGTVVEGAEELGVRLNQMLDPATDFSSFLQECMD